MKSRPARDLGVRLSRLRALVLDVDGVLTDGGLYYGERGEAMKRFDVRDGLGLRRVREAGLLVAFITGEDTPIVLRRAEKLGVRDVRLGIEDKLAALEEVLAARGIAPEEAAYMGDDLTDLPPMGRAGLAVAVADAAPEVLRAAHWVTRRAGGSGAVREVCDAILAQRLHR